MFFKNNSDYGDSAAALGILFHSVTRHLLNYNLLPLLPPQLYS